MTQTNDKEMQIVRLLGQLHDLTNKRMMIEEQIKWVMQTIAITEQEIKDMQMMEQEALQNNNELPDFPHVRQQADNIELPDFPCNNKYNYESESGEEELVEL